MRKPQMQDMLAALGYIIHEHHADGITIDCSDMANTAALLESQFIRDANNPERVLLVIKVLPGSYSKMGDPSNN